MPFKHLGLMEDKWSEDQNSCGFQKGWLGAESTASRAWTFRQWTHFNLGQQKFKDIWTLPVLFFSGHS